jgi:hypothetical protein
MGTTSDPRAAAQLRALPAISCPYCKGRGFKPNMRTCKPCMGTAEIQSWWHNYRLAVTRSKRNATTLPPAATLGARDQHGSRVKPLRPSHAQEADAPNEQRAEIETDHSHGSAR